MLVIMNPPYSGNLFLKITEKVLEANPAQVIMLGPVRWLQDPLKRVKQNSDFTNKDFHLCVERLDEVRELTRHEMSELFTGSNFSEDAALYFFQNGGFDFTKYDDPIVERVLEKKTKVVGDFIEKDLLDGHLVRVNIIKTASANSVNKLNETNSVNISFYLTHISLDWHYENGRTVDGIDWFRNKLSKAGRKQYTAEDKIPYAIRFESDVEANNFEKSTKTNFYRYVFGKMKSDQNVPNNYLPFMDSYKEKWDDKRFYEYFNITEDEQKEIYNFLKKNNVPNLFGEESEGVLWLESQLDR